MSTLMVNPQPPPMPLSWRLRQTWRRTAYGLKQFAMRFTLSASRSWWWSGRLGATRHDYAAEVGDGRGNAIVMACVRKIVRIFPDAPIAVQVRDADGEWVDQPDTALQELLDYPNPFYSGLLLWAATVADYLLTGNAYWIKVKSAAGRVVELWWVPSSVIDPKWPETGGGSVFISHYEYRVNGRNFELAPEDVVHFRDNIDPDNGRKGLSPLASLFREIATDDHAANWTASLLRNMGVPGVVLSPGDDAVVSPEDAEQAKTEFSQRFGGDRRGEPLVMRTKTQVSVLSFNPQQMDWRAIRQVTEERVSAVLGPAAVVVGLGAGLARSTYSNMEEAREDLYKSLLIPMQRALAADLAMQLIPDFGDRRRLRLVFDRSQIRELQEDETQLHERVRADLLSGLLKLGRAQSLIGEEPDEANAELYYIPVGVTPTEPDNLVPPEPVLALPAPGAAGPDEEDEEEAAQMRAAGRTNGHAKTLAGVAAP